jgi:hypothetical protein
MISFLVLKNCRRLVPYLHNHSHIPQVPCSSALDERDPGVQAHLVYMPSCIFGGQSVQGVKKRERQFVAVRQRGLRM